MDIPAASVSEVEAALAVEAAGVLSWRSLGPADDD